MPTVLVPAQLTVEHLMAAVKQLSPAELHAFVQQFAAWQDKNGAQADEEAILLAVIEENSRRPAPPGACTGARAMRILPLPCPFHQRVLPL